MLLKELKRYPMRPVDDEGTEYGVTAGKYVGVKFTPETKQTLSDIIHKEKVPNAFDTDKLHSTVAYSKGSNIPGYEASGKFDEPIQGEIDSFDVFPSQDGCNCLVAKLNCPELDDLHNQTMEHGANYDFDEYIPHVTFSYDAGEWSKSDLDRLTKKYKGTKIDIDEEYEQPIDDDFKDKLA